MNTTDYPQLLTLFDRQLIPLSPAEAHGLLTALISAGETEPEEWLGQLFGGIEGAHALSQEDGLLLAGLFGDTQRDLSGEAFEYELFLPDDDAEIDARVAALATWCQGYLFGLGIRGLGDSPALSDDAKELIADLTAISRAAVEDAGTEEADEEAYAEIVEYVKVGVLSLHEDLRPLRDAVDTTNTLH
ncbi:MAG: UPF0149 family protein [Gammaproteobacteria bacterium]|nr:UPF0149 family protein [Gammaproteobacteria bacterium]MCP5136986.1 UPF0149 family protein [Gammaproteobacteria bacterium]